MCYLYMNNDEYSNLVTKVGTQWLNIIRLFSRKISHYLYYCDVFELAYTVVSDN